MLVSLFATLSFFSLQPSAPSSSHGPHHVDLQEETELEADCPAPRKWVDHRVKGQDTLHRIARRYRSRVVDIVIHNPSIEGRELVEGELLRVCKFARRKQPHRRLRRAKPLPAQIYPLRDQALANQGLPQSPSPSGPTAGLGDSPSVDTQASPAKNRTPFSQSSHRHNSESDSSTFGTTSRYVGKTHKSCGHRSPLFQHRVIPGEILSQIATRYGVASKDLVALNPSLQKNPDRLSVGQKLAICPKTPPRERTKTIHVVKPGESLLQIAANYNVSRNELLRYQSKPISNPNYLRVGQKIVVWKDGGIAKAFRRPLRTNTKRRKKVRWPRRLHNPVNLVAGSHYTTKHRRLSWGTARSVALIQSSILRYKNRYPHGPKVHVGDLSLRRGGHFPPHVSHRTGHDVDIGYVLKGKYAHHTKFIDANRRNMDVAGSWALIRSFLDSGQIQYIFLDYSLQRLLYRYVAKQGASKAELEQLFQYPRRKGHPGGIIRHSRGHVNHFHVRFWPKGTH